MKVLFVKGCAMEIADDYGVERATKETITNGGKLTIETDEIYSNCSILEFGEVDRDFLAFMNDNFVDYDDSKETDFFIIDEEEN